MTRRFFLWGAAASLFLSTLLTVHPTAFAEEKDLSDRVEQLEKEMNQLNAKGDSYDYLKEETKAYREFVEGEWDRFLNLLQWVLPLLVSLVISAIAGVFMFFNRKSIRDFEKAADKRTEKMIKDLDEKVSLTQKKMEEEARRQFYNVMEKEVKQLQKRIKDLERIVDKESWIQNAKILSVDRKKVKEILSESTLNQNNITYDTSPFDRLFSLVDKGEVDIIIYEYDLESENQKDSDLISILKRLQKPIPIVVYTAERVEDEQIKGLLEDHRAYKYANTPDTLVSNTYRLADTHYSERDEA